MSMIRLDLIETEFQRKFRQFCDAPRMSVDEIRALGHQWRSLGNGYVQCDCGAAVPSDQTEDPGLFRKTLDGSLLSIPCVKKKAEGQ